ncbi:PVC-type heme-binding CxxCH protein [Planctomicrobium sp. SH668]|uniref:PVC-type heme-binding CxxCH protein n=1 Tax=Planctomicrobium sp. SH668 TaxID=3448126 RepID=UPI003F5AE068
MGRVFCRSTLFTLAALKFALIACFSGNFQLHFANAAEDPFASVIRPTPALSPEDQLKTMHVPEGFRITLFASEPQIQKPINMAFDDRGRLWIAGTVDYPFVNLEQPGDRIQILEDTDGDGVADKIETFVDGITHPMGILPYQDGVIAFVVPNICFFRDLDGDGKSDSQEVLYGPFDYSRDTHGLNNGFRQGYDGWIYACHGFNNNSVVKGKDGHEVSMSSGNIYRFRPDGSRIEQFTFGQINPFGLTFDRRGDLFDTDCHTKPLTLLMRDGQYQGFGRKHDGLGFVPDVMHHSHGSTAIAGIVEITDSRWPLEYQNNYFVGNVMTSRLNRDALAYSGSSMSAVEQPDFLICDDPWFRPVDLQLGPDGAVYVADFYNKIIGHYEVDLKHPERDRTRGRIWRIEYIGDGKKTTASNSEIDLKKLPTSDLIKQTETSNIPLRLRMIHELSRRAAMDPVELKQAITDQNVDEDVVVSLLWGLKQAGKLESAELATATKSASPLVRLHVQRILADAEKLWGPSVELALAGLDDSDPFVKRAAADALARHPSIELIKPLMTHYNAAPESDPMLVYQLRIALRNQLRLDGGIAIYLASEPSAKDQEALTEILLGVDTKESANFLLSAFGRSETNLSRPVDAIQLISKWVDPSNIEKLVEIVPVRFQSQPEMQLSLLETVREGLRRQNAPYPESIKNWARNLVTPMFDRSISAKPWTVEASDGQSPWGYQLRQAGDDQQWYEVISSLPGGEQAMSRLKSPTFELPQQFSFIVCGHLGLPGQESQEKCYVRVCLAETGEELYRDYAPRSDVGKPVTWDLTQWQGKQGFIEVVDELSLSGFAWVAAGRFRPEVVSLPTGISEANRYILGDACRIVGELSLVDLVPKLNALLELSNLDTYSRDCAAGAVARFQKTPASAGLASLQRVPSLTLEQRQKLTAAISDETNVDEQRSLLAQLLKPVSTRYQIEIARTILDYQGGGQLLLDLCDEQAVSPRIFASSVIRPRYDAMNKQSFSEHIQRILEQLPSATAERDATIQRLTLEMAQQNRSAEQGMKVFEARCAACHQVRGIGKVIGPQLDGVGNRGAERLFEDILDPNRNVDISFRNHTFALEDGRILSGIIRRNEGDTIVIADNKGEEHSFSSSEVDEQAVSSVSIMPDNWSEMISDAELCDLMAFLLQQKK